MHRGRLILVTAAILVGGVSCSNSGGVGSPTSGGSSSQSVAGGALTAPAFPAGEPSPRESAAIADGPDGLPLLTGGVGMDGANSGDAWKFDGSRWTKAEGTAPTLNHPKMVRDPNTHADVLIGQESSLSSAPYVTYTYDGHTWTKVAGATIPAVEYNLLVADTKSRQVLAYAADVSGFGHDEVLLWTGTAWKVVYGSLDTHAEVPPSEFQLMVGRAFDFSTLTAGLDGAVFGLYTIPDTIYQHDFTARVAQWNGSDFVEIQQPGAPRDAAHLLLDAPNKRVIALDPMVSAEGFGATKPAGGPMVYDGQRWTVVSGGDVPSPLHTRTNVALGSTSLGAVAAGGVIEATVTGADTSAAFFNDLLRFDGKNFVNVHGAAAGYRFTMKDEVGGKPSPRTSPRLVDDETHHRLLLSGGSTSVTNPVLGSITQATFADNWTFDGKSWSMVGASVPPLSAYVVDGPSGPVEIGAPSTATDLSTPDQTWAWDGSAWHQAHPSSDLPANASVRSVAYVPATKSVAAVVSRVDPTAGLTRPELWMWNGTAWSQAWSAANDPTFTTPAGDMRLAQLSTGPDGSLIAVRDLELGSGGMMDIVGFSAGSWHVRATVPRAEFDFIFFSAADVVHHQVFTRPAVDPPGGATAYDVRDATFAVVSGAGQPPGDAKTVAIVSCSSLGGVVAMDVTKVSFMRWDGKAWAPL